jgi:hypothetical protein
LRCGGVLTVTTLSSESIEELEDDNTTLFLVV